MLVQSGGPIDSAQAPAEDTVTPSWPKAAARAACQVPLSKEAARAAEKLWGSGGWGRTCGGHFAGVAGHLLWSGCGERVGRARAGHQDEGYCRVRRRPQDCSSSAQVWSPGGSLLLVGGVNIQVFSGRGLCPLGVKPGRALFPRQ